VYVPAGPFKVGSGAPSGIYAKFADGPDMPLVHNMNNIRSKDQEFGGLTDGSWRGGSSIPCLIDAAWNGPAAEGTHARRFGIAAGDLWGTHTYWEVNVGTVAVGGAGVLNDEYPTGYEAFYCMKYELTQGQYVDFLNSLPPDVAAERAFVGSEVGSDAGMHSATAKLDMGPGREPRLLGENGGCTIYSSADIPQVVVDSSSSSDDVMMSEEDKKQKEALDNLVEGMMEDKKDRTKKGLAAAAATRPVYTARLPFRRLPGATTSDTRAYAVWAGLRPMSQLEGTKAGNGARDPTAPPDPDWTSPKDFDASPVLLDEGLPTERYLKGNARFGCSFAPRVGCRSTPTSDRGTALATYWGISELGGPSIPVSTREFRGTHGNGMTSPGKPGASFKRTVAKFKDAPADWPEWWSYLGGHFVETRCRLVVSADNGIKKPAGVEPAQSTKPKPSLPLPPLDGRKDDLPRVANVNVESGKEFSTVSFDLAWNNSWRAKWNEPVEKNCTGKPMPIESWDAAWVFVKFRTKGALTFSHATLSPDANRHAKPAGAALDMGLSDDGAKGIGVFIYRDAVGQGANEFKGIKLRWQNGVDQADGATAEFSIHAIPMVYVPDGAFRSKSPFVYSVTSDGSWSPGAVVCPLMTIDTPDTTKPSGHVNSSTNYVREGPDWPNGYGAFYCMKYSISQGEYARFLTEVAPDPAKAGYNGQYGYGPHNAARRYSAGFYGLCGYTIRYSAGEMRYEADVPERPANFLSDADINSFTAWAGLRPLTKLEYEKACRGPRAVAKDEDAWASGACAPAAGLAQFVPSIGGHQTPTTSRLAWPGPSYWGIRDLSQSGAVIEWPAVQIEDGRGFAGNHGTGTPDPPGGWVFTSRGEWYCLGMWQGFPLSQIGVWFLPEDFLRLPGDIGAYISTRSGRYGARAVRTAARSDKDVPLQVDAFPNLVGYDLAIANLSGRFKNDGEKPLKVELVSSLPPSCFLRGSTSRGFTAAAKAVTPFKMPLVLTRALTSVTERGGRGLLLPVQIKGPGGETLGEAKIRLPSDVLTRLPGAVQSLDGGKIDLKMTNATENLLTLALEMPSLPAVRIGESKRTLTVAAGAEAVVAFPVPRQGFPGDGVCQFPFRVAVAGGAPQSGAVDVELSNKTRWWITRRSEKAPNLDALDTEAMPG
ncbi:MAG: SUMF1/EgtB/PvdO family nonheme iron enzyme, partial [Kiritimatiellia bacterium]